MYSKLLEFRGDIIFGSIKTLQLFQTQSTRNVIQILCQLTRKYIQMCKAPGTPTRFHKAEIYIRLIIGLPRSPYKIRKIQIHIQASSIATRTSIFAIKQNRLNLSATFHRSFKTIPDTLCGSLDLINSTTPYTPPTPQHVSPNSRPPPHQLLAPLQNDHCSPNNLHSYSPNSTCYPLKTSYSTLYLYATRYSFRRLHVPHTFYIPSSNLPQHKRYPKSSFMAAIIGFIKEC